MEEIIHITGEHGVKDKRTDKIYSEVYCKASEAKYFEVVERKNIRYSTGYVRNVTN